MAIMASWYDCKKGGDLQDYKDNTGWLYNLKSNKMITNSIIKIASHRKEGDTYSTIELDIAKDKKPAITVKAINNKWQFTVQSIKVGTTSFSNALVTINTGSPYIYIPKGVFDIIK